jgi:hypothetical protein
MHALSDRDFVTITADATIHTKGSYTEIIASTAGDCYLLRLFMSTSKDAGDNSSQLMDIAIGGAGSEVIIIADLQSGFITNIRGSQPLIDLPFFIPAGTRISARLQAVISADTCLVSVSIYGGSPPGSLDAKGYFGAVDTYGEDVATSRGVQVTTGDGAGVKGSWVEITSSCDYEINAFLLSMAGDGGMSSEAYNLDIGVGAAASEVVVVSNFMIRQNGGEYWAYTSGRLIPLGVDIPAGTRVAVRGAVGTGGVDSNAYVHLHGLRL